MVGLLSILMVNQVHLKCFGRITYNVMDNEVTYYNQLLGYIWFD